MDRERKAQQGESRHSASARKTGDGARTRRPVQWKRLVPSPAALRELKIEALYRQAAIAFHRNGYAGTSLADIAASLGVSKAALYHYIENKQELLLGCHMAASDVADAVIEQVPQTGLSGLEKLRMALRLHVESILSEDSPSVLALEESALTPENFRAVVQRRDRFQAGFMSFMHEGISDGSIIDCDPKLAIFALLGGVNWAEKWYRPGGPWSPAQIAQAIADMLIRGVATLPALGPLKRVVDYPDDQQIAPLRPPGDATNPRETIR